MGSHDLAMPAPCHRPPAQASHPLGSPGGGPAEAQPLPGCISLPGPPPSLCSLLWVGSLPTIPIPAPNPSGISTETLGLLVPCRPPLGWAHSLRAPRTQSPGLPVTHTAPEPQTVAGTGPPFAEVNQAGLDAPSNLVLGTESCLLSNVCTEPPNPEMMDYGGGL